MPEQLGDAPIEPAYVEKMNAIARGIDQIFNGPRGAGGGSFDGPQGSTRGTGFVLMVFPFGDDSGRCNYISNGADREDVVKLMREQIRHFENDA